MTTTTIRWTRTETRHGNVLTSPTGRFVVEPWVRHGRRVGWLARGADQPGPWPTAAEARMACEATAAAPTAARSARSIEALYREAHDALDAAALAIDTARNALRLAAAKPIGIVRDGAAHLSALPTGAMVAATDGTVRDLGRS